MPRRQLVLISLLSVILLVVVVKWFMGSDTVTLDFTNAPISKVLKSIKSQTGVQVFSTVDPNTPITIHVRRIPVYDALDTLSVQSEGDLRLAYIGAPQSAKIDEALSAFTTSTKLEGWTAFGGGGWGGGGGGGGPMGGGGGGMMVGGDTTIDPRTLEWQLTEVPDRSLQAILNQASQKSGAMFAIPTDWNPVLGKLPPQGTVGKMAQSIASAAKGKMREVFLLSARPQRQEGSGPREQEAVFTPSRIRPDPVWIAERTQSQIAKLPPTQRQEAKKMSDDAKAFFASVRDLPQEERRVKMEEYFNKPEVQAAMDERMAARDAKMTPTQREKRARDYVQRKQAAKQGGGATK